MANKLHDNSITAREATDVGVMQGNESGLGHLGPMSKRDGTQNSKNVVS